jgi:hypothetical protein
VPQHGEGGREAVTTWRKRGGREGGRTPAPEDGRRRRVGNEWREGEGVWNVGLGFGVHVLFVRDSLLGWLKGQCRIERHG